MLTKAEAKILTLVIVAVALASCLLAFPADAKTVAHANEINTVK